MPPQPLDRLENLPRILPAANARLLIVADSHAFEQSGAKRRMEALLANHDTIVFSDFQSNPSFEHSLAAAELLADDPSRVVIAIGGGAAIDTAKIASFAAANLEVCRKEPVEAIATAGKLAPRQNPLIAIPTTAGTGSEATHFAVVYVDAQKHSLCHDSLLPEATVLDPTLTHSLPPGITASTGLDALSQAIESLWNIHSTPASEKLAEQAMQLALENIEPAVCAPNPECRAQMLLAANLAGQAINITRTTAPHALSYYLTIHHGVPHGFAVAIFVGKFLCFNATASTSDLADRRGLSHLRGRLLKIANALGGRGELVSAAQLAAEKWHVLLSRIGAPTRLKDVGVSTDEQFEALLRSANVERLSNNPRVLDTHALQRIVESLA